MGKTQMSNKKLFRNIILFVLIIVFATGIYLFGSNIPLINKIPYFSQKHDHVYRPLLDEKGQIEYWTCAMHPSVR